MIQQNKIHIVPNFAQDYLFLTEKEISNKYSNTQPLKILYIGGLIQKKGYNELAEAYFGLDEFMKKSVRIDFAGMFESESRKKMFLEKIAGVEQIRYHGIVSDAEKKLLFSQSHIFCLPTSFFEGQPISILEAYASGCVVLTTGQSGIRDIFTDGLNGFEVQERSSDSIRLILEKILENPESLQKIAISNRNMAAEKYRTSTYCSSLRAIIESQAVGLECSGCRQIL
jgi:glycosyltransferase involved in cell wall biosynthesis